MKVKINLVSILIASLICLFVLTPKNLFSNEKNSNDKSFVFVILCHVRNEGDDKLWRRCYQSVREFYPEAPIIIIDDNSYLPISDHLLINVTYIRSDFPLAGEILPYYYFLQYQWADQMIFLHDSMFLARTFTNQELSAPIKFHWHFEDHRWDDDVIINSLLGHLENSNELIVYNSNKQDWNGCFGVASIIDLKLLKKIEEKYCVIQALTPLLNTRWQRCMLERIFALIMFKEKYVNKENCSNFGNIHLYPYCFSMIDDAKIEQIKSSYPSAIIKTWHGR